MSNLIELEMPDTKRKIVVNLDYIIQINKDNYVRQDFKQTKVYTLNIWLINSSLPIMCFETEEKRDYYYDCLVNAMSKAGVIKVF